MRTLLALLLLAAAARAADDLKPGWTPEALAEATAGCTEELVQRAWANTQREQHVDADKPLTPDVRKRLEPQIAAMRRLCACAVSEGAKRYDKAAAEKMPKDLDQFVAKTITDGTCKLESD